MKLSNANAQNVFLSADGSAVVADFGFGGLRRWTETGGWVKATNADPLHIAVDAACETVVADFGAIGLFRWTATDNKWQRLSRMNVLRVAISADGGTVVADFNNRGLSRWTETGGWLKLSPMNAERGLGFPRWADGGRRLRLARSSPLDHGGLGEAVERQRAGRDHLLRRWQSGRRLRGGWPPVLRRLVGVLESKEPRTSPGRLTSPQCRSPLRAARGFLSTPTVGRGILPSASSFWRRACATPCRRGYARRPGVPLTPLSDSPLSDSSQVSRGRLWHPVAAGYFPWLPGLREVRHFVVATPGPSDPSVFKRQSV